MAPYWVSAFGQISHRSLAPQATGSKLIRNLLSLSGLGLQMKKMISAEIVCICDRKPDFQQVGRVKTKASNKEVDMLTELVEDVNPCEQ